MPRERTFTYSARSWEEAVDRAARDAVENGWIIRSSRSSSWTDGSAPSVQHDPEWADRYRIEISEATAYPEVLAWQTDGLMNRMAAQHGEPNLWRWERVRPISSSSE